MLDLKDIDYPTKFLIAGSRDGEIKIWRWEWALIDLVGRVIHSLVVVEEREQSDLISLLQQKKWINVDTKYFI